MVQEVISDRPDPVLGEWTLHPASNELVHRSGRHVRVEDRAMRLLVLLHANAGQVVTSEEILDRIWTGKVVSPHSIATVVSDLRKVMGDDSRQPRFIETIPKRGYRLLTEQTAGADAPHRRQVRRAWPIAIGLAAAVIIAAAALLVSDRSLRAGHAESRSIESGVTAQYVRARELWSRREHDAVLEARRLLLGIVAEDPRFAPAHAALADIYAHKTGEDLGMPELETFREAQRHLDAARALSPTMAEIDVTQALLDFYRDHQPRKALTTVNAAVSKDPDFAYAWQTRAMLLSVLGEHDQSLEAISRARELDPISSSIGWDEVWFTYLAGESDRAWAAFEREARNSGPNYLYRSLILDGRGHERGAIESWLERLSVRNARLANPQAIRELARAGRYPDAYREMLSQTAAVAGYSESPVVLSLWEYRAGDAHAALSRLKGTMPERRSWLTMWAPQLPPLEALLREASVAANSR
jgi:DNA-binding winged helix-turn-helix (wHTH) protein